VEDILQDVFYQLVGNTEPIEQLTAWLFRVARNKITDRHRKHKPDLLEDLLTNHEDNEQHSLEWIAQAFDKKEDPENLYLHSIFWETLHKALDELPEEQRNVFVWHEMEGQSFKEIAEKTGESVNTLLSRKRYAILHLRKGLKNLYNELLHY
jgi:RNA polymerase sigma factor (sigma-70 family)